MDNLKTVEKYWVASALYVNERPEIIKCIASKIILLCYCSVVTFKPLIIKVLIDCWISDVTTTQTG